MSVAGAGWPARYFFLVNGLEDEGHYWVFQADFDAFHLRPAPLVRQLGMHFFGDSMVGWYDIPTLAPTEAQDTWAKDVSNDFFARANLLRLLLSFALGRHIEIVRPSIYLQQEGEWQHRGGGNLMSQYPPSPANVPLVSGREELANFVEHAYRRMVNDFDELGITPQTRGLALALRLLNSSWSTVGLELKYLQSWMAFEILVTHAPASQPMFEGKEFKPVRATLSITLKELEERGKLSSDQRVRMSEMLAVLQRPSIARRSQEFLDYVFERYPAQKVSREDLRRFIGIRDSIAHAGSATSAEVLYDDAESSDYGFLLHRQRMRLTALLERVVFAMLNFECDLLSEPWNSGINA
jgi:hypothetical protein